jgi:hypothetical protein
MLEHVDRSKHKKLCPLKDTFYVFWKMFINYAHTKLMDNIYLNDEWELGFLFNV